MIAILGKGFISCLISSNNRNLQLLSFQKICTLLGVLWNVWPWSNDYARLSFRVYWYLYWCVQSFLAFNPRYVLTLKESDSFLVVHHCPNGCFHNGDCIGAICFCYPGWTGEDCSQFHCRDLHNCSGNGECIGPNACKCHPGYLVSFFPQVTQILFRWVLLTW